MKEVYSIICDVFSLPHRRFSDFRSCLFRSDAIREMARFRTMSALGLWDSFYCSPYSSVYYFLRSVQDRLGLSDLVVLGDVFLEVE